jgi:hypothetical protein
VLERLLRLLGLLRPDAGDRLLVRSGRVRPRGQVRFADQQEEEADEEHEHCEGGTQRPEGDLEPALQVGTFLIRTGGLAAPSPKMIRGMAAPYPPSGDSSNGSAATPSVPSTSLSRAKRRTSTRSTCGVPLVDA